MTPTFFRAVASAVAWLVVPAIPLSARATERRFAFNAESSVLAPGDAELEPWTTVRAGREHHFVAFDQRLEFELGLTANLQTSLYWNIGATSESVFDETTGRRTRTSSSRFQSLSSEWKYKFSDALADVVGFAASLEGSYGPEEAELEAKLIFNKQLHNLLLVANLVGQQEWKLQSGPDESGRELLLTLGAGLFVTPSWVVAVEAISRTTLLEGDELESSALYAGPSVAYSSDRYWLALGAAPQVFAPKSHEGDLLELTHGEHLWARALLGFRL